MTKLSRRKFLRYSGVGLCSAILAACGMKESAKPTNTVLPPTSRSLTTGKPVTSVQITPTQKPKGQGQATVTAKPRGKNSTPEATAIHLVSDRTLILGRPTDHSITASLLGSSDQQIVIAYGVRPGEYHQQTNPAILKANLPQNIELTSLLPGSTYFYQILCNEIPAGEHSFSTQRLPGSSYSFTIDADPHNRDPNFNGGLYALSMANVLADRPDFHINLGDTFMTEKIKVQTYAEAETTFTDMRPYFGIIGQDVPLFLVNGNHEGELGWLLRGKEKDLPVWSTQLRHKYYPNPIPGGFYSGASTSDPVLGSERDGYYAWTWGDALFIVLDPYWYTLIKAQTEDLSNNWNWTLGQEQYHWLKSVLETSRARFKFVFIHNLVGGNDKDARGGIEAAPYFEWGGKNPDGTYGFDQHRPGWGKPIHTMLVQYKVNAVFHGHDHVFVKQDLDGIVYQECPQASITDGNNTRMAADYGYTHGDILGSSGHLRVTVQPEGVFVEYIRAYLQDDPQKKQINRQIDFAYAIS